MAFALRFATQFGISASIITDGLILNYYNANYGVNPNYLSIVSVVVGAVVACSQVFVGMSGFGDTKWTQGQKL
jgi:hypothetical protein